MDGKCPFTGKDCPHPKVLNIVTTADANNFVDICWECSGNSQEIMISPLKEAIQYMFFPEKRCEKCGLTLFELNRSMRFGCDKCYEVFKEEFLGLVGELHNLDSAAVLHTGKVPTRFEYSEAEKLRRLRISLDAAVAVENYEEAALIKKEIDKLEGL